jgi:hypothetical protein
MFSKTIVLFCFICISEVGSLFAQNFTISGKVRALERTTGAALQNVRVDIDSSSVITKTDVNGNYSVNVPAGIHNIRVSLPGYIGMFKKDWNINSNTSFNVSLVNNMQESPSGNIVCNLADYNELNFSTDEYPNSSTWNSISEGNLIPIRLVNANSLDSTVFKNAIGLCNGNWLNSPTNSVEYKQKRAIYLLQNDPQIGLTTRGIYVQFHQGSTLTFILAYESGSPYIKRAKVNLQTNTERIIKKEVQGRSWAKGAVGSRLSYMNGNAIDMDDVDHMLNIVFFNFWAAIARSEQNGTMFNMENTPTFTTPLSPSQLTPADKALGLDKLVGITFKNVFAADWYRAQFSTTSDFSNIIKDTLLYKTSANVLLNSNTKYFWRILAGNDAGSSAWSATREFDTKNDIPTSVSVINAFEYKVYPNPVGNQLNISISSSGSRILTIDLYSIDGRILFNKNISTGGELYQNLDFSKYNNGTYYLRLKTVDTSHSIKVIKQ